MYEEAVTYINRRDELRRDYDHYDEKLENISSDTYEKDQTYLDRNHAKYKKAMEEYVKYSIWAYEQIQKLLDYRYNRINPCVLEVRYTNLVT
jgi:hypothetical protein